MMSTITRFYLSPTIRQPARSKSLCSTLSISMTMGSLESHEFIWAQNCLSRERPMEVASLLGDWGILIVLGLTTYGTSRQKYSSEGKVRLLIFPHCSSPTPVKPWMIWLSSVNLKQLWRNQPQKCLMLWEFPIKKCSWLLALSKSSLLFQRRPIFRGKI